MKNINYKHTILLIVAVFFLSINAIGQVAIGTTDPVTPDASSMLDVQSTTKGMLIPRMTTTQRTAISSPAKGLLVFDLDTETFWFYTTAWEELVAGSSAGNELVDADGDTKVEVEKTSDIDEINFTTIAKERMRIANDTILMGTDLSAQATTFFELGTDGTIKLGNKGASTLTGGTGSFAESDEAGLENYTRITADGSLNYVGNATRWEDLKVNVSRLTGSGIKAPTRNEIVDAGAGPGLFLYWFNKDTEQELFFTVQMPHGWKEGSDIKPHVHWVADDGSGNVEWALEYTWANVSDTFSTTTTTLTSYTPISAYGDYKHMLTQLGDMSGSGKTLSSIIICRIFRKAASSNDTFDKDAGLLQIDFHYQVDSDGSNSELKKW